MVTKKAASNPFSDLDDEAIYSVELKRPLKVGRGMVRPGTNPELKGKVIKENADGVEQVIGIIHGPSE